VAVVSIGLSFIFQQMFDVLKPYYESILRQINDSL